MLNVINRSNDPYFNMAVEEYVLKTLSQQDDCFMLWQNRPAIIVGRNQNAREEINQSYVQENNIAVVRRLTGGGAVYHDLGNLNFTFVVRDQGKGFDFERFSQPVIAALSTLGIEATHSGRNDILINGQKFSGNAEYRLQDRLLHHGTLLFASDLTVLGQALQVKESKIAAKGVKSVRSRVTNISEHLPSPITIEGFRSVLVDAAAANLQSELIDYQFSEAELIEIIRLRDEKYATWNWTYGRFFDHDIKQVRRYPFGEIDVRMQVRNGQITDCQIYGDFFSNSSIEELAKQLIGADFERASLDRVLANLDVNSFFPALSRGEFLDLLLSEDN